MDLPIATESVTLPPGTRGQDIVNAVRELSGAEFYNRLFYRSGKEVFLIGKNSHYPYEGMVIAHENGNTLLIDLHATYENVPIAVANIDWPDGMKYAVNHSDKQVIEAVKKFAAELQAKLNELASNK